MSLNQNAVGKMTNYRWTICAMLFFATTVNYLDRQVLSLTWDEFIKPEFHWDESHYGTITSVFSIVYAVCMLFAGRFIDWMGTKKGFLWAIGVWSAGACLHALCGIVDPSQRNLSLRQNICFLHILYFVNNSLRRNIRRDLHCVIIALDLGSGRSHLPEDIGTYLQ